LEENGLLKFAVRLGSQDEESKQERGDLKVGNFITRTNQRIYRNVEAPSMIFFSSQFTRNLLNLIYFDLSFPSIRQESMLLNNGNFGLKINDRS
jgi:hypothetical protein